MGREVLAKVSGGAGEKRERCTRLLLGEYTHKDARMLGFLREERACDSDEGLAGSLAEDKRSCFVDDELCYAISVFAHAISVAKATTLSP